MKARGIEFLAPGMLEEVVEYRSQEPFQEPGPLVGQGAGRAYESSHIQPSVHMGLYKLMYNPLDIGV